MPKFSLTANHRLELSVSLDIQHEACTLINYLTSNYPVLEAKYGYISLRNIDHYSGANGWCISNQYGFEIKVAAKRKLPEVLFTLAHEYGHALQHLHPEYNFVHPDDHEKDADAFALKIAEELAGILDIKQKTETEESRSELIQYWRNKFTKNKST